MTLWHMPVYLEIRVLVLNVVLFRFLMRKSVTKAILDAYVRRKGVMLSAGFKGDQIGEIQRLWKHIPQQKVILSFLDFSSALHLLSFWLVGFSGRRLGESLFCSYENNWLASKREQKPFLILPFVDMIILARQRQKLCRWHTRQDSLFWISRIRCSMQWITVYVVATLTLDALL